MMRVPNPVFRFTPMLVPTAPGCRLFAVIRVCDSFLARMRVNRMFASLDWA
ncbi:hypothetical protein D1872_316630 [compost metagenome]